MSTSTLGRTATLPAVLGLVLFPLGMVGQEEGGLWPDGPAWIGAVGWFGFLLCVLLLLVLGVVALARTVVHRRTAGG